MKYSQKKLPLEAATTLVKTLIKQLEPFRLVYAPVYISLQKNKKFVSIKAPLDFFTKEDLNRIAPKEHFYYPEFIKSIQPIQRLAARAKEILNGRFKLNWRAPGNSDVKLTLAPIPYEASNEILKVLASVWWDWEGKELRIEPLHVVVFVNELCSPLPIEKLTEARELGAQRLEQSLFLSSWIVFFALHLGYCDISFLDELRAEIFEARLHHTEVTYPDLELNTLLSALGELGYDPIQHRTFRSVVFTARAESVARKISGRLIRVRDEFLNRTQPPSIFGDAGFIDE